MESHELADHCQRLGLSPGATTADVERAFMRRNFALVKGGEANAAERAALRAAHDALVAHLDAAAQAGRAEARAAGEAPPAPRAAGLITPPVVQPREADGEFALLAFANWKVNALVPPLLLAFTWLVHQTPVAMLLKGFHVWMHEFGHATAAWMCGRRALPLPFGWTNIEPDFVPLVYWGLLLLFALLFLAGLKERKVWPMVAAVVLAALQFHMTWRMPEHRQEFWWGSFCGVGGEFYLSTLFMMAFFVHLPEKFRWGACRYGFFLIGATAFLNIVIFWNEVYHGREEIPFGTLIGGEEDGGGDMNKLMEGYGWTKFQIRRTYQELGHACWIALGAIYAVFALRFNRAADWVVRRMARPEAG